MYLYKLRRIGLCYTRLKCQSKPFDQSLPKSAMTKESKCNHKKKAKVRFSHKYKLLSQLIAIYLSSDLPGLLSICHLNLSDLQLSSMVKQAKPNCKFSADSNPLDQTASCIITLTSTHTVQLLVHIISSTCI